MLQFLLKKLPKIKQRHRFLCKIILLSAAGHGIVVCIALVTAQFSSHLFILEKENMRKYERVVLIPLARRIAPDLVANKQIEDAKIKEEIPQTMVAESAETENLKAIENFKFDAPEKEQEKPKQTVQNEIAYVGRDDLQEIKLYKTVFNAIEKVWQPPVGFPADSVCEIAFIVKEGKANNIEILKSSKVAAYDIAARCAVARAHFERQAHGKKCTVVFKL